MTSFPTPLPRITVITPSYQQGAFIEQTIQSVLGQDYPDLEYLVMDGGSTDSTLDVLERYKGRLQYISEPDRGQSHAINKGLQRSTGEVVCFLNSDDLLAPQALHKVGNFFQIHPQAYWLTGRCRMVDEQGREVRRLITAYKNCWLSTHNWKVLEVLNYISQPATFWRREVIERVGFLSETLRYALDYDYWMRIGQHYQLWVVKDELAHFRVHSSSKGGTGAPKQFAEELEVARRFVRSRLRIALHSGHNALLLGVYRGMKGAAGLQK